MEDGQTIAYISDVGAQGLKPLFIAGSCVTTVFLDLAFAAERWLRHTGALERNSTRNEKILSVFASMFALAVALNRQTIQLTVFLSSHVCNCWHSGSHPPFCLRHPPPSPPARRLSPPVHVWLDPISHKFKSALTTRFAGADTLFPLFSSAPSTSVLAFTSAISACSVFLSG